MKDEENDVTADIHQRFATGGALQEFGAFFAENTDRLIGESFGGYRILRHLATGGMGAVYLAERADHRYDRNVAIKLLTTDTQQLVAKARFAREVAILGQLSHPNIAQLFDAGISAQGWSYFVMEYVEGEKYDEYHRSRGTALREKVSQLVAITDAVAAAHTNLVIHRDIKPSNLLVDEKNQPRLLDFGIAKMLDGDSMDQTNTMMLTPAYASPEQLLGKPISVSSDIYQLGLLFLSSFRQPDTRPASLGEAMALASSHNNISAESMVVDTLPRELCAVINKCLRTEPKERYQSAAELKADLRRYLGGYPVQARNPGAASRIAKFIKRNKVASAATAIAVTGLIGATSVSLHQREQAILAQQEAFSAAELAAEQQRRAEQTTKFLTDLFDDNKPTEALGEELTAKDILARGLERLAELNEQPILKSDLLKTIAGVYRDLGNSDKALGLAQESLQLRELAERADYPALIDTHRLLTRLNADTGEYQAALEHGERAVALGTEHLGADHLLTVENLAALADVYQKLNRLDDAESALRKALAFYLKIYGEDHLDVTTATNNLAVHLQIRGRYAEAATLMEQVLAYDAKQLPPEHPWLAMDLFNYGNVLGLQGRYEGAIRTLEKCLAMRIKLEGEQHQWTTITYDRLARAVAGRGDFERALVLAQRSDALSRQVMQAPNPYMALNIAHYGDLQRFFGDYDAADALLSEAHEQSTQLLDSSNSISLAIRFYLGRVAFDQGNHAVAKTWLQPVSEAMHDVRGRPEILLSLSLLASMAATNGDIELARRQMLESLSIVERQQGPESKHLANARLTNAFTLLQLEDYSAAQAQAKLALEQFIQSDAKQWRVDVARAVASRAVFLQSGTTASLYRDAVRAAIARLPENAQIAQQLQGWLAGDV